MSHRRSNPFGELQSMREALPDLKAPENWPVLSYFVNVSDEALKRLTEGGFPGGKRQEELKTHPVLLLKREGNISYRFCPCSTKNYMNYSKIPAGTHLKPDDKRYEPDGYICHKYCFNLPPQNSCVGREHFFGVVNEPDIIGEQYKEGMR